MPGTARDEAERLVAAALGAVSVAARGAADSFATGSAECCVCPVCRVIAAMRDPDPEAAERLASGAGDLAAGVAGILRALGSAAGRAGSGGTAAGPGETAGADEPVDDDPWRAATRNEPPPQRSSAPEPKPMAKKAVRKVVDPAGPAGSAEPAGPVGPADPTGRPE